MNHQPKPEVKCEHKLNKKQMEQFGRDECMNCGEWIHSPASTERECENGHKGTGIGFEDDCPECEAPWKSASTEEWEKEFDELITKTNWVELYDAIKSFIRSHDQQLRQRIVEQLKNQIEVCRSKDQAEAVMILSQFLSTLNNEK